MNYFLSGIGNKVIVLIHGYCSDYSVWEEVKETLEKTHRLLIVSIPGYASPQEEITESIHLLAKDLKEILKKENIDSVHIVGHSMGGYIGLEFLSLYEENVLGLTLLNSHCYSDAEDKKTNRKKTIDFLSKHGTKFYVKEIYKTLFSSSYQEKNVEKFAAMIARATNYNHNVLIQSCHAMINRKNHKHTLESSKVPVQFILGALDQLIPINDFIKQAALPKISKLDIIDEMGHMGMLEQYEATIECLLSFNHYATKLQAKC